MILFSLSYSLGSVSSSFFVSFIDGCSFKKPSQQILKYVDETLTISISDKFIWLNTN